MSATQCPANTLRQHRPLLLAMEAIGWFHMAGKARAEFLRRHGGEENGYKEVSWHQHETPPFPWDDLLNWVKDLPSSGIPADAWPSTFADFTEKHKDEDKGLLGLLQAGHGMVSSIEKNVLTSTSNYLKQTIPHTWLSSPWGHPKRNLLADPPEVLTPHGWEELVREIRRVLEELGNLGKKSEQEISEWRRWREQAIGEGSFIRRAFLSTLAETRLPNNDVTLWDQSYVAAALFKSAVAGALLNENFRWENEDINEDIKQKTRWRLLTVALGTGHYEARAVKIGDWTGAQGDIEEFFRQVAELVEVDLAVGSLLYRDDSAVIFSFPGEHFKETTPATWLNGWEDWLQGEVDGIAHRLHLETPPYIHLSGPTRSLVPMVQEWRKANETVAIPIHRSWDISDCDEKDGHVCPVCGVRLNGDPTNKGKPCAVCRERRHHRRDAWLQRQLGYDTIWFDEVADANSRLAMLTFSLDLEGWLNGKQVDSLRAQAISEWCHFNATLSGKANPIDPSRAIESLQNYIKDRLGNFDNQDVVLRSLQYRYNEEKDWPSFFQKIVEDRAEAPKWEELNDNQRAAWLAHQLLRKLPSPGRVYRFWREAEEFFTDLLREFRQITARSDNSWRVRRLLLIPNERNNSWKDLTLYDGRWQGKQISMMYVQHLEGFVTTSNLACLLKPQENKNVLQNAKITLEDEDASGLRSEVTVNEVREVPQPYAHLGVYHPVIPVDLSPLRFRVLVPLEAASACVDLATAWWQERFARVWDRLPLRVGVIAFPRMTPYQAVVEATRNAEDALEISQETWQVQEVEQRAGVVALRLRRHDGQEVLRVVPITMPDGREDVFYPYVAVEDCALRFSRDFQHPNGQVYRHMADLRPGDGIRLIPSRVKTLFLESTASRFDTTPSKYLQDWKQMREVWALLQRIAPSQTAVQQLRGELTRLEHDWQLPNGQMVASDALWRDTLRALIVHHIEGKGAALEVLTEAAVLGLLQWAIDWHMSVLKANV